MTRWLLFILFLAGSVGTAFAGDCVKLAEVCTDGPATKVINGVSVFRACWHFQSSYDCRSVGTINDCQALRDRACAQTGSSCVAALDDGSCATAAQTYSCPDRPQSVSVRTVCDQSTYCSNGSTCFNTSSPPDQDFGQAAAMMEAAREAGVYGVDPSKIELFKGYAEECSTKVLGGASIKSCCGTSVGGNVSNYALVHTAMSAAGTVGEQALQTGSKYVYDALYQNIDSGLLRQGLSAMGSSLSSGAASSTFSAYGFEYSFSFSEGFTLTGFDPSTFAISVGIMLVQQWLACDQGEQALSLKRGQNLCAYVESYCSKKVLGVCVERRDRHCCFNSILARLINRQGRAQLGLPMNQCGGFNQAQLQSLNFAAMDLSEFIASIVPKSINQAATSSQVGQTVQQRVTNYYEQK